MSANDIDEIAERALEKGPEDINDARDAANFMGLDLTAPEQEIIDRYRDLSRILHPDGGGNTESFVALQESRNRLLQAFEERISESEAEEARKRGAPESPGTGGWGPEAEERQEIYRQTFDEIKVFFVENLLGVEIQAATIEDALRTGEISERQIDRVEELLRESYGVPELTLDDIARVLASLIVTGSIRLGSVSRMADTIGALGGEGFGSLGRGRRGGEGFSSLRR